jgi:hypothetical protein
MVSEATPPPSGAVLISNVSTPSALPIDCASWPATAPVASCCAVWTTEICCPSPSELIGWLKTISDRMSACSSGGGAGQDDFRLLHGAADVDARFDALNQRRVRMSRIGSISFSGARRTARPVAQDLEPASLEIVGAAHGVDRADQRESACRGAWSRAVAAERDVDRAEADRAPGARSSLALTTRSSGTVTRTSIVSASSVDGGGGGAVTAAGFGSGTRLRWSRTPSRRRARGSRRGSPGRSRRRSRRDRGDRSSPAISRLLLTRTLPSLLSMILKSFEVTNSWTPPTCSSWIASRR